MFFEKIKEYNNSIAESIRSFSSNSEPLAELAILIKEFKETNNIDFLFGSLGSGLKTFLNAVDETHPELFVFLKNQIFNADSFKEVSSILSLNKYCKRKKLSDISQNFYKLCVYFSPEKILLNGKTIDDPKITKAHTRFLTFNQRWDVRSFKNPCKIVANKVVDGLFEYKDDSIFTAYHHNSNAINNVIYDLEKKKEIFISMNCNNMAKEVDLAINKIKNDIQCQSLGFHRITLTSVAKNIDKLFNVKNKDIKIYPVHLKWFESNDSLKLIVGLCDNFPFYENKYAAFDHYAVIKYENDDFGIIVGERDTQSFFLGYYHE